MKLDSPLNHGARLGAGLAALAGQMEVTRSIAINGERRLLRLESDIWSSFKDIAAAEGCTADELSGRDPADTRKLIAGAAAPP